MIVDVTDTTVTLSWLSPDPPNGIITQYQVQYKRSGSSSFIQLTPLNVNRVRTVTGLDSDTQYEFRVTASTGAGDGTAFSNITARTSKLLLLYYRLFLVVNVLKVTL